MNKLLEDFEKLLPEDHPLRSTILKIFTATLETSMSLIKDWEEAKKKRENKS